MKEFLESQGYYDIREIRGRGLCGLYRFIFTVGLCYGLDEYSYKGRYCFDSASEAKKAIDTWDGKEDPDGDWIKHKGSVEYSNPKLIKN